MWFDDPKVSCPDENLVLGFVEGRLDGAALAQADAHLAACDDCRQVVAALARGSTPAGPGSDSSGNRVGRYVLLEIIGRGGMGVVHAAWDPELDRRIAVKLLRADLRERDWDQARVRLMREGRAIARLAHPNVVTVHDVGDFAEGVFVAIGAGHAFKFASLIGRTLAELAIDGRTDVALEPFSIERPILKEKHPARSYMV